MKFLGGILLVAGCTAAGPTNVVNLTIVSDSSLTAELRAKVTELDLDVTGVQTKSTKYALSGLPAEERVQLLPKVSSGTITVAVSVKDANTNVLGKGSVDVPITGKIVPATVTLSYQMPPQITVTPATAKVTRTKTQQFMADRPVVWSVTGTGTIDENGLYTAPDVATAMDTIVATSSTDTTNSSTATVNVFDYGLELVTGALGGWGEVDGIGAAARFSSPTGIADDRNGHLYIADAYGCTLRRYDIATQAVTTIGGKAGVCVDQDGQLDADARFALPLALTYDATRNLLWVGGGLLRRVDLSTGTVTTVSTFDGTQFTFGVPIGGLAVDEPNDTLYVSSSRHVIYRYFPTATPSPSPKPEVFAGIVNTPGSADTATGPATLASFFQPSGLAFDGTNLYVSDTHNQTIRKIVVASGVTSTIAGTLNVAGDIDDVGLAAQFNRPGPLALSPNKSTLYVGERGGDVVRSIALVNGSVARIAGMVPPSPAPGDPVVFVGATDGAPGTIARFNTIFGLVFDQSTNSLFVVDGNNGLLRQLNGANFAVTSVAGKKIGWGYKDGLAATALFFQMGAIASDGASLYIADEGNSVIRKYDLATDMVSTVVGKAGIVGSDDGMGTDARINRPDGLFLDGKILYFTDSAGATLRSFDLETQVVTTLAGQYLTSGSADGTGSDARLAGSLYLTGDHQGHLYLQDGAPVIRMFDIATRTLTTIGGNAGEALLMDGDKSVSRFLGPYGLALENGLLYVCDQNAIRSVTLSDPYHVTTVAGGPVAGINDGMGTNAQFGALQACVGDGAGHIYFGDVGRLRRFDVATTQVTTLLGTPYVEVERPGTLDKASLNSFGGGVVTPAGDLYFSDGGEGVVMMVRLKP